MAMGETMSLQKSAPIDRAFTDREMELAPLALQPAAAIAGEAANKTAAIKIPTGSPAPTSSARRTRAEILTGTVLPTLLKLAPPTASVFLAPTAGNPAKACAGDLPGTDARGA